jgi:hypothetical protein
MTVFEDALKEMQAIPPSDESAKIQQAEGPAPKKGGFGFDYGPAFNTTYPDNK